MLEFVTEHYLIIMIVSVFLIFALIGYIIDQAKNKKRNEITADVVEKSEEIPDAVAEEVPVEEEEIAEVAEEVIEENTPTEEPEEVVETVQNMIPEVEEPEDNN